MEDISEFDGGVQCLWVRDVSEDPRHTSYVTLVRSTNSVKVLGLQPWCRLMDVYVLERDHRKRLAAEERPDSPVPHPMGPQKCWTIEETIPRRTFFHGLRRTADTGVWNGHTYDDVPAITIAR